MMRKEKIYIIARGIGGLFVCWFFSNLLAPEFVAQHRLLVIIFLIFLVGGVMYYRHLQRKFKKKLALKEEKLKLQQEKLQNDLTETMKELVVMHSEIRDYHKKNCEKGENGHNIL
ncbi:hypothetical protein [Enterococcus pallens]|nr:hypothetical protein [Enterococcus pallens]OJG76879.1 hypothetical protein RV10_GL003126 [Enterococcus pallens]